GEDSLLTHGEAATLRRLDALWDDAVALYHGAQGTLIEKDGRPVLTSGDAARMRASGHTMLPPPVVVDWLPLAANAEAALALLAAGESRHDATLVARSRRILQSLAAILRSTPFVPRDVTRDGTGRLAPGAEASAADVAELGLAFLQSSDANSATLLARALRQRYFDPSRACFTDAPPAAQTAPGRWRVR